MINCHNSYYVQIILLQLYCFKLFIMKRKPKLHRRVIKSYCNYKIVTDSYSRGLIRWYNGINRWLEFKSPFWHLGGFHRQMWYSSIFPNLSMIKNSLS